MNKQLRWDITFLKMAQLLGENSHCVSRQVGTLFIQDGRILTSGINGTAIGETNCDELFHRQHFDAVTHREWSDVHEIHAEQNALLFAAKKGISLKGSTVYSTLQPCSQCSKMLAVVGIKRIVFSNYYDRVTGSDAVKNRLEKLGIEYHHIDIPND
jgi:dCMP deaminase